MSEGTYALKTHRDGWKLVRWIHSSIHGLAYVEEVKSPQNSYPATLHSLKNPITLPNKIKRELGITY